MNDTSKRSDSEAAPTLAESSALREQTAQAREVLSRLQRDIENAESRLGRIQAAQLLEANEQLVLAILRAQTDTETATMALDAASHAAEFDALTDLPGRVLLLDRLAQAIAHADRHGTRLALLFMDLDNFKQINDTLGHAVGDRVLMLVARRLETSVRAADTVSRHGGDEFLILLSEVSEAADTALIARKVLAALSAPSHVGDHVFHLNASIGICIYPDDAKEAEELIDKADAAMYRTKKQGPGSFAFYGADSEAERDARADGTASPSRSTRDATLAEHERRHAQLRDANEQLVLAALNAQELLAAAEQTRQRQRDLLVVVAHELRNPLAPIRTAASLLDRANPNELRRLQAVIERQVMQVTRLVSDLLDTSRVDTGKLRLEMQRFDLSSAIDQAVDICRAAMNLRSQHLELQCPAQEIRLNGDPTRLAQVLGNLLDNASKYTPKGGRIELAATVDRDDVVVTVTDNGIGMTTQALSTVFEPFVQEPRAVAFNGLGLGLGLTVVRELVEAHGGTVTANSAGVGLGSRFIVTLPLAGT